MLRGKTFLLERGGLVAIATLVFYGVLACPQIVENDNAEFATLGAVGGVAHPSGYPLYVLWLRAWSWLPGSAAHDAALATALLAALSALVLHAACRAWGARALVATFVVGIYAGAPLVVRYSTQAEAFTLNSLVVATVMWLAASRGPVRGVPRVALLALVAGLGMSNHLTCTLVTPVGVLGVVRGVREAKPVIAISAGLVAFAVGLLPYAYLLVASENLASYRNPNSLGELYEIVSRQQFGGPFGFTGFDADVPWGEHLGELAKNLARSWWVLGPLGVLALGVRIVRPPRDAEPRAGWIALAACFVLSGPVLTSRFDLPLDNWGTYVVERFHLLPILFLVIPIASGVELVVEKLARVKLRPALLGSLVGSAVVANALAALPYVKRFQSPAVENEVRNTLASLPANAILVGRDDELDFGARYLQLAEREYTGILYVRWMTMHLDWYRARFAPEFSFTPKTPDIKRDVIEAALATGRPVFVTSTELRGVFGFVTYPHGIVSRVLPAGSKQPALAEVLVINRELFAKFDLDYEFPGAHDQFATWVHQNYARVWKRLGDIAAGLGEREEANELYAVARQLAPR